MAYYVFRRPWTPPFHRRARASIRVPASGTNYVLNIVTGTYAITGNAVALKWAHNMPISQGSYAITGNAVRLWRSYTISITQGSYSITGNAVALKAGRAIALQQGSYNIIGNQVTLTYSGQTSIDLFSVCGGLNAWPYTPDTVSYPYQVKMKTGQT